MTALTIAEILSANDARILPVECPEWGGTVYVRSVHSNRQDAFDQKYSRGDDGELDLRGYRADMVAMCLCDEEGKFLNPSESEIDALGRTRNAAVVDRIFGVCQIVTGQNPERVEELEKNLAGSAAGNGSG